MSSKRDIDVSRESGLIWKVANDVLRDIFQRTEYPDIIYPMVLIRRLECVLEEETEKIQKKIPHLQELNESKRKILYDQLKNTLGYYNDSKQTLLSLIEEGETGIKNNFINYLNGFKSKKQSASDKDQIQEVINNSGIRKQIDKLNHNKILFSLIQEFVNIPLSPNTVSNIKMGYIFEELVRKFSEQNNSEAGEHYTPREVIDLMVKLLDMDERKLKNGELVTIYDPACGTGGMLTTAKEYIEDNVNEKANVRLYGQEVNDKTWSICEADLMIKGENAKIVHGDTLYEDGFVSDKFDFMLSNPPYGKSWAKIQEKVMSNSQGRFSIGTPRSSDGQLLFTLHMISKMKSSESGGSAIAIVHNGSPLFSGDAEGGESSIRQYIIEKDLLETIVALPTQLFYNTGISTYVWILRNNKPNKRKGKVQLINAVDFWKPMKRSLGDKRRYIDEEGIKKIVKIHKSFQKSEFSKIYDLDDFAYRKVTIELEELDENGNPLYETKDIKLSASKLSELCEISEKDQAQIKDKTKPNPKRLSVSLKKTGELVTKFQAKVQEIIIQKSIDGNKLVLTTQIQVPVKTKDIEVIPWKEDWKQWLDREVEKKWTFVEEKKGYEIPFTKEFYVYQPLRELETVLLEFATKERKNLSILKELGMKL